MNIKIHAFHMLTLCIYFIQTYSESNETSKINIRQRRDWAEESVRRIFGVSEQFIIDYLDIFELNGPNVNEFISKTLIEPLVYHENSKIDIEYMKNFYSEYYPITEYSPLRVRDIAMYMDDVKILQDVFAMQMPPERYDGLINLLFIFKNANATTTEITIALNYLYGIDSAAIKTSFLNPLDFPHPDGNDCSAIFQRYSRSIDELKSIIDIKPRVIHDYTAIRDKFPCTYHIQNDHYQFMYVIARLHGNGSKIDACMMKESPGNWSPIMRANPLQNTKEFMEYSLRGVESVLSTRLTDETFRGINDFLKATIPGTSIEEIEKALEYLYDDVPKSKCPSWL